MNKVELFKNDCLKLKVRIIKNEDGSISVNAEDIARGLGWVDNSKSATNGAQLSKVRWARVNDYLTEFGFKDKVGKDDYIPESAFYLLGMKANNKVAKEFQKWLAVDVIPSIRKTGQYTVQQQLKLEEPYTLVKKTYKGNPVMTLKDVEYVSKMSSWKISYYLKGNYGFKINSDYFLLVNDELRYFKEENNLTSAIPSLFIVTSKGFYKLVDILKFKVINEAKEYFEEILKNDNKLKVIKATFSILEEYNQNRVLLYIKDLLQGQNTNANDADFFVETIVNPLRFKELSDGIIQVSTKNDERSIYVKYSDLREERLSQLNKEGNKYIVLINNKLTIEQKRREMYTWIKKENSIEWYDNKLKEAF